MLDMKKLLAKMLKCDYVIEEGTSGSWTYKKWNSGEYEATYTAGFALNAGSAWWTGAYFHKTTYGLALPSFALDWHLKSAQKSDATIAWCVGALQESDGLHFYWVNGSAAAVSGSNFMNTIVTIYGRWK